MFLLPVMAAAQDEWSAIEADSALSALFSRQFVLPDEHQINAFECIIGDTIVLSSPVSRYEDLVAALQAWQDTSSVAPKTGKTRLYYSPLFYANTGDTLYCDAELQNRHNAYGEKAAMFNRFVVRNQQETPYYIIVRHHHNRRALYVYETGSDKPFMIERDAVYHPMIILKDGQQLYLSPNGKSIAMRQVCHLDTFLYAEELDKSGHVAVKYTFRPLLYTTDCFLLDKKETFYPSGSVQMRTVYGADEIQLYAFRQDGSEEKLTPVPYKNIDKAIRRYFKEHFKAPDIGNEKYGIKEIKMKMRFVGSVSEKGEMTVTEMAERPDASRANQPKVVTMNFRGEVLDNTLGKGEMTITEPTGCAVTWAYRYDPDLLLDFQLKDIISASFAPYLRECIDGLTRTTLNCPSATLSQQPLATPYSILFEYSFKP